MTNVHAFRYIKEESDFFVLRILLTPRLSNFFFFDLFTDQKYDMLYNRDRMPFKHVRFNKVCHSKKSNFNIVE